MRKLAIVIALVLLCLSICYGKTSYYEITVWATAYSHQHDACYKNKCICITATGSKPKHGTIAVDPKVIPLYSKVYVPGYGIGAALDTGVKGHVIDLWFDTNYSEDECYDLWGCKKLPIKVYY